MFCHRCGVEVLPRQRFCGDCGAPLAGVTDQTGRTVRPASRSAAIDPSFTDQLPVTQAVTGVFPSVATARRPSTRNRVYDFAADEPDDITAPTDRPPLERASAPHPLPAPVPTIVPATERAPSPAPRPVPSEQVTAEQPPTAAAVKTTEMRVLAASAHGRWRFRFGVVTGTAVVAVVVAVVGLYANVVSVHSDATTPAFATGDWLVSDLGSNLRIAGLIGVLTMLAGAVLAGFGVRAGAGLAGGAGLAVAGWSALVVGLSEQPLEVAKNAVEAPTTESFTVTITRDLGYWLLLASMVIGAAVFVVSLVHAGNDNRSGLNPWIAAIGAVSALVAAGGPLVPEGLATVRDNWTPAGDAFDQPAAFLLGRLTQVALLVVAGVIGFLQVRRWGLGVAIGGMLPVVWLAVTTLLEFGDAPVGPAFANPGSAAVDLHAVTVVGMTAFAGLAIVAVIAAYDQSVRERP